MSQPIDFLLKCFNALTPALATEPSTILDELIDYRRASLVASDTTDSTASGKFRSTYNNYESTQSAHTIAAASFGLTASYGPYSGSFQASSESERQSDASVINGTLSALVDRGTLKFKRSTDPKAIAAHLDPELLQKLNEIDSLSLAENFTKIYGTHLVLGVKLGGVLEMSVIVTSKSLSSKDSLAVEVKGKYAALGNSIEAVAKASKELNTLSNVKSVEHKQQTLGGDSRLSAGMNIEDAAAIQKWVDSCTELTVSGVSDSVELYTLATNPSAKAVLRLYLRLCLLKHSVENPVIFSRVGPLMAGQYNTVSAPAAAGYKIISGGAALDQNGPDFLASSYPLQSGGGAIASWQAVSHDASFSSPAGAQLVSYALGVYDPANLLVVGCGWADGGNPDAGPDEASQFLDNSFALTGGGCQTSSDQVYARFVTSSYPAKGDDGTYNKWIARSRDNMHASKGWLKAWVVGIKLQDAARQAASISNEVVQQAGSLQSHGTTLAVLGGGTSIAGGGVELNKNAQNLVHASFPVAQNGQMGWQEFNGDLGGVYDAVVSTSYAITLHFNSLDPAISFQPFGNNRRQALEAAADPR